MTFGETIFPIFTIILMVGIILLSIKLVFQGGRARCKSRRQSEAMKIDGLMNNSNKGKSIACFVDALKDEEIKYSAWRKQI